jgi:Zn-dependent metalloprotease
MKKMFKITCKLLANYLQITCKNFSYALFTSLCVLSFSFVAPIYAQNFTLSKNGTYASVHSFAKQYSLSEAQSLLKTTLQTDDNTTFKLYASETDNLGYTHSRFQQYYKGVKVQYAVYFVHSKDGNISHINGDYRKIANLSAQAQLSVQTVLENAFRHCLCLTNNSTSTSKVH